MARLLSVQSARTVVPDGQVRSCLPAIVAAVCGAELLVLWSCDPMHGDVWTFALDHTYGPTCARDKPLDRTHTCIDHKSGRAHTHTPTQETPSAPATGTRRGGQWHTRVAHTATVHGHKRPWSIRCRRKKQIAKPNPFLSQVRRHSRGVDRDVQDPPAKWCVPTAERAVYVIRPSHAAPHPPRDAAGRRAF